MFPLERMCSHKSWLASQIPKILVLEQHSLWRCEVSGMQAILPGVLDIFLDQPFTLEPKSFTIGWTAKLEISALLSFIKLYIEVIGKDVIKYAISH